MAWIEIHQTLPRHRKTLSTAGRLSVDRHTIIGHLLELWTWAIDNVPSDGFMGRISFQELAIAADWRGDEKSFVSALIESGFIDENPDGLWLHDWYEYAGKLLEKREKEKERSKNRRSTVKKPKVDRRLSDGRPQDRPMVDREKLLGTVPNSTVPNQEKVQEQKHMCADAHVDAEPIESATGDDNPVTSPVADAEDALGAHLETSAYPQDFEDFWAVYPRKINKSGAFKCFTVRKREGAATENMYAAARNYAVACKAQDRDPTKIMHASTFLGPSKRFEDYTGGIPEGDRAGPRGFARSKNMPAILAAAKRLERSHVP